MAPFSGLRRERVLASKQFRDGAFHNTAGEKTGVKDRPWKIMREFFFDQKARVPVAPLPVHSPFDAWEKGVGSGLRMTWMGHSTMLVEIDGFRVLTDPVFGDRASPLSFAGPKRFHPVPATITQLPPLDCVVLSHNHHDHLCPASIRELARRQVPIVTSLGVGAFLEKLGVRPDKIFELDWWEEQLFAGGALSIRATPSQHFSGRGVSDRNATLWSSWVITTDRRRIFFSGDTGLTDEFAAIATRFAPFDVTMLEIGAWHPAWGNMHLGPTNALRAFETLGGGALLPVHWSTFDLSLHRWDEPAETLLGLTKERGARLLTPRLGLPFEPAHQDEPSPWWREVRAASGQLVPEPA